MPARAPLEERFWKKVDRQGRRDCWPWLGAKKNHGYGMIAPDLMHKGGSPLQAHRVSWELHRGPIPKGKVVHHICFNRGCMNPLHMILLSPEIHATSAYQPRTPAVECKKGHSLEDAYVWKRTNGDSYRSCRTCKKQRDAAYRALRRLR